MAGHQTNVMAKHQIEGTLRCPLKLWSSILVGLNAVSHFFSKEIFLAGTAESSFTI